MQQEMHQITCSFIQSHQMLNPTFIGFHVCNSFPTRPVNTFWCVKIGCSCTLRSFFYSLECRVVQLKLVTPGRGSSDALVGPEGAESMRQERKQLLVVPKTLSAGQDGAGMHLQWNRTKHHRPEASLDFLSRSKEKKCMGFFPTLLCP